MTGGLRYTTDSHDKFYDSWTNDEVGEKYAGNLNDHNWDTALELLYGTDAVPERSKSGENSDLLEKLCYQAIPKKSAAFWPYQPGILDCRVNNYTGAVLANSTSPPLCCDE